MKIYILLDYNESNDDIIHSVYANEVDAKLTLADFVLEDPRADFGGLRIVEKELKEKRGITMKEIIKAWRFLEDNGYFTYGELQLATSLNGYSMETLNDICEVRYAEDLEDMGFEED